MAAMSSSGPTLSMAFFWERIGQCPSGRVIRIVWRWNEEDGEKKVFVSTAF
jgi:hypothetical protein